MDLWVFKPALSPRLSYVGMRRRYLSSATRSPRLAVSWLTPSPLCMCLANHAARAGLEPDSPTPTGEAWALSLVFRALKSSRGVQLACAVLACADVPAGDETVEVRPCSALADTEVLGACRRGHSTSLTPELTHHHEHHVLSCGISHAAYSSASSGDRNRTCVSSPR